MKIIHFHPDERMAANFVVPLMKAERGAGYQTELLSSSKRVGQGGIVISFDLSVANLFGLPLALWRIWAYLKKGPADVVFSHNTKSSLLPLLGAWLAGVHVRVYFNHGVPYVGYRGILRWALRALERWNSALATHVVTVSQDMVMLLQDVSLRIRPRLIHNGSACGIDLNDYSPGRYSRVDWRKANGLREKDLVVVYVGRAERRKGFEFVLRLWAEHFHDDHIKLVLCGPALDDVLKYSNSVPSNVICLGFVNNVPEVLSGSDLMILPSMHEGLSYACLEAQAAGVAIAANDICGIRCVIEDGINGFLVPNNDITKYVEIIRMIDNDRTSTKAIQWQARTSVGRFSREIFMPSYLSFLSGLLPEQGETKPICLSKHD